MRGVYSVKEGDLHWPSVSKKRRGREEEEKKEQTSRKVEEGSTVENQLD